MCNLSSGILEQGRAEGRTEGERIGLVKGENKMSQLVTLLLKDNKIDILQKASTDEEFRKQLFVEYGL